ncbi:hypothetical protein RclHR1_31790001 [Rhizophagus clarus]|uniref:Uncharacterized protein n=1 Tax=Rhizophagus clarus TaxID=94130 RepID=A0A2Z6R7P2_9GLOM|nr:hypothetical protein RclHR1_31790001 [Rhizophagus clarus]GES85308.1 hypothetical protein GLOIN_2v1764121 [Rhizophagus clarus]
MPTHQRKLIKNYFVLRFVPFGDNFDEFMLPFVSEIKELENGKIMTIQEQNAWVIADLDVIMADLPQGNNLAGVLRYFNLINNSYRQIYFIIQIY